MTSYFDAEEGKMIACTVVEAGPCVVTQVRSEDKDGYAAYQIGYDESVSDKNVTEPLKGHFKKIGVAPLRHLIEFKDLQGDFKVGDTLKVENIFTVGDFVDVVGTSKGKGFQGVVKRYGFGGVGGQTHGQHNRQRHPGSVGACSFPSRVFKGMRMAGRTGGDRVKVANLRIVKIMAEKNLLLVSGAVPGAKNSIVILEK